MNLKKQVLYFTYTPPKALLVLILRRKKGNLRVSKQVTERSKWIWISVGSIAFVFFAAKFFQAWWNKTHKQTKLSSSARPGGDSSSRDSLQDAKSKAAKRLTASDAGGESESSKSEKSKKDNNAAVTDGLEGRLKRWDAKAEWNIRRENRLVRAISGGFIPSLGKDIKSVEGFLYDLGDDLGVSTKDLGPVTQRSFDVENIYEAKQMVQGYAVNDAFVKVFARTSDGTIYYVASELKTVHDPLLRKDFDENAAREIVGRALAGKKFSIEPHDETKGANPRIFVKDENYSELVWVLYAKVTEPKYDRRRFFIGTQSGQVLLNESLLIH